MALTWDLTRPDPYPRYRELRERAAVHHFMGVDPDGTWVVVRHATALSLFRDPRFLRNRNHPEFLAARGGESSLRRSGPSGSTCSAATRPITPG